MKKKSTKSKDGFDKKAYWVKKRTKKAKAKKRKR
jgi:hypothetical protein